MNSKEKEIIEKLINIATKQQKIIQKLAQSTDPIWYGKLDPSDPRNHDPLYGGEQSPEEMAKSKPATTPPPAWLDKYMNPPAPSASPEAPSTLPEGVKEMIDRGAPALKNNLMLHFNGKNVGVRYNRNALNYKPEVVHTLLQNALPGYKVDMPVGETGNMNLLNDWHPNY